MATPRYFIGLMSGTSVDAIDAALVAVMVIYLPAPANFAGISNTPGRTLCGPNYSP